MKRKLSNWLVTVAVLLAALLLLWALCGTAGAGPRAKTAGYYEAATRASADDAAKILDLERRGLICISGPSAEQARERMLMIANR